MSKRNIPELLRTSTIGTKDIGIHAYVNRNYDILKHTDTKKGKWLIFSRSELSFFPFDKNWKSRYSKKIIEQSRLYHGIMLPDSYSIYYVDNSPKTIVYSIRNSEESLGIITKDILEQSVLSWPPKYFRNEWSDSIRSKNLEESFLYGNEVVEKIRNERHMRNFENKLTRLYEESLNYPDIALENDKFSDVYMSWDKITLGYSKEYISICEKNNITDPMEFMKKFDEFYTNSKRSNI